MTLSAGALWAAPQKVLLLAGKSSFTQQGLEALGVEHDLLAPEKFGTVSPFDYDLIIWGMDMSRGALVGRAKQIDAFVRTGGVLLMFRQNSADSWLPVPVQRDKAYAFGEILAPEHPIFNEPNRFTKAEMLQVHGGSIYDAYWDMGEGWRPL